MFCVCHVATQNMTRKNGSSIRLYIKEPAKTPVHDSNCPLNSSFSVLWRAWWPYKWRQNGNEKEKRALLIECRKTKTKVVTLAHHKGHRQSSEPIKTRSKYMELTRSAGKWVRASHDWFWFYFWLVKKVAQVLFCFCFFLFLNNHQGK